VKKAKLKKPKFKMVTFRIATKELERIDKQAKVIFRGNRTKYIRHCCGLIDYNSKALA
jgi:hypothetical protein